MKKSNRANRIAFLLPAMAGGGAERAVQTVGKYYSMKGDEIYYFLMGSSRRMSYSVSGTVIRLGVGLNDMSFEKLFETSKVVRKAKKRYGIDVSISFMEESNFLNVLSKGREKVIVSVRTTLSPRTELVGLFYNKLLIKLLYNLADKVVTVSLYGKLDLISQYGIRAPKISVIPNPAIKQNYCCNDRWEYGEKTIVCLGRLDPVKQQDRIIRAFSYAKQKCEDAQLLFVGEGQLKRYFERVSRDCEVADAVHFIGFTDAPGYYIKHSKVLVMASRVEGFPNAMVEAMAYGVPVVTTDSPGGCGEIVGKENSADEIQYCKYGILTPYICGRPKKNAPLDKEEILLGQALLSVLNDEKVYTEYSEKSRQRAEYYSYQRVMKMWDDVLGLD